MVSAERLRLYLPDFVRRFPPDLAILVGLVLSSLLAAFSPGVSESVLRVLLGALLVLFAPGYAITAALFPESGNMESSSKIGSSGESKSSVKTGSPDHNTTGELARRYADGISLLERAAFSVGLSIIVMPLLGFLLNFTPWSIHPVSLLVTVGGFTVGMVVVASIRRWRVPPKRRLTIPYGEWYASARAKLLETKSRTDLVLHTVLVVAVLVAAGSGAYAVLGPENDQSFTELYLLSENESGAVVADDYPTTAELGEEHTLVAGITNHEHRPTTYSVLVELQRVAVRNDSATVLETQRVGQFRQRVGVNETARIRHTVTPEMAGDQLRVQYLLYVGDPPPNPTEENAYRHVHFWMNVTNR